MNKILNFLTKSSKPPALPALTPTQVLAEIKKELKFLQECYSARIVAQLEAKPVPAKYQLTKAQATKRKAHFNDLVAEYLRRSKNNMLKQAVIDCTGEIGGRKLAFPRQVHGNHAKHDQAKYLLTRQWLQETGLASLPGAYMFWDLDNCEAIYIGQAKTFGARLQQHERKTYFRDAEEIWFFPARTEAHLNILERSLIYYYDPRENRSGGHKSSPMDSVLNWAGKMYDDTANNTTEFNVSTVLGIPPEKQ